MLYQNLHRSHLEPMPTDLWQAYRASFENFARQAATHQAAAPGSNALNLEQARIAYAQARNALADTLLEKHGQRKMVCA